MTKEQMMGQNYDSYYLTEGLEAYFQSSAEKHDYRAWMIDRKRNKQPYVPGVQVDEWLFIDSMNEDIPEDLVAAPSTISLRSPLPFGLLHPSHLAYLPPFFQAMNAIQADIKGKKICDLGSGSGPLSFVAQAMGAGEVVGYDNDELELAYANSIKKLNNLDNCHFRSADISNLDPSVLSNYHTILANIGPHEIYGGYYGAHIKVLELILASENWKRAIIGGYAKNFPNLSPKADIEIFKNFGYVVEPVTSSAVFLDLNQVCVEASALIISR